MRLRLLGHLHAHDALFRLDRVRARGSLGGRCGSSIARLVASGRAAAAAADAPPRHVNVAKVLCPSLHRRESVCGVFTSEITPVVP